MLRSHHCGELRASDAGKEVVLCGWVQKKREMGAMIFIDLRDRYGITQLAFNQESTQDAFANAKKSGREFVVMAKGKVAIRESKNIKIETGEIEIIISSLEILNESITPPFTIENYTEGGDELRIK